MCVSGTSGHTSASCDQVRPGNDGPKGNGTGPGSPAPSSGTRATGLPFPAAAVVFSPDWVDRTQSGASQTTKADVDRVLSRRALQARADDYRAGPGAGARDDSESADPRL
ncbi:MAG: hypothetical protein ACLPKE_13125 [Streptosporangiaceae bacterium]